MQYSLQSNSAIQPYSAFLRKFVREKEITFRYKKEDKYWLIKSWLHRRRSAHFYTVVHINNNHQDTPTSINIMPRTMLPVEVLVPGV